MNKFYFFFVFLLLIGCQPEGKPKVPKKPKVNKPGELIQQDEVLLLCQPVKNPSMPELPETEVFLQLAENKTKVADVMDCEIILPKQFAEYDIPKNAISAVGGWWAGSGDYLYILEEDGEYVIKKTQVDEMQPDSAYQYQEVVRYNKKGEIVMTND